MIELQYVYHWALKSNTFIMGTVWLYLEYYKNKVSEEDGLQNNWDSANIIPLQ